MSKDKIKKTAKYAAKLLVTSSCSKVAHDIIDAHVTADTPFEKVQVWVGAGVIAGVTSMTGWNYCETMAARFTRGSDLTKIDFSQCQTKTK